MSAVSPNNTTAHHHVERDPRAVLPHVEQERGQGRRGGVGQGVGQGVVGSTWKSEVDRKSGGRSKCCWTSRRMFWSAMASISSTNCSDLLAVDDESTVVARTLSLRHC